MAGQIKVNQVQLGDSATATQNFVWQTNVDGTTKLARGNVGATTQDILTVDATGKVTLTASDANLPIGVGQTWQDMIGSRAINTTYTNSTGRPIEISVTCTPANTSSTGTLTIGGVVFVAVAQGFITGAIPITLTAIIPNGVTYSLVTTGTTSLAYWKELR